MNAELFPFSEVASDSPKTRWLCKHALETQFLRKGGSECVETGDTIPNWVCRVTHPRFNGVYCPNEIAGGDSEEEACASLALARGLKLWNEE